MAFFAALSITRGADVEFRWDRDNRRCLPVRQMMEWTQPLCWQHLHLLALVSLSEAGIIYQSGASGKYSMFCHSSFELCSMSQCLMLMHTAPF